MQAQYYAYIEFSNLSSNLVSISIRYNKKIEEARINIYILPIHMIVFSFFFFFVDMILNSTLKITCQSLTHNAPANFTTVPDNLKCMLL